MTIEKELVKKFGAKIDKPELIQSCEQIMKIFSISVEDLFLDWESYIFTKHDGKALELTTESLLKFQDYIQERLEKKKQHLMDPPSTVKSARKIIKNVNTSPFNFLPTTPSIIKKKKIINSTTPIKDELVKSSPSKTPILKQPDTSISNITPTPLKQNAQISGEIIETLNPSIESTSGFDSSSDLENPLKLTANFDAKKYSFRTMRTKLLETADVLDSQIEQFMQIIQEHHKLNINDFANPLIIQQSQILTVGRIVSDNPNLNDELNQLNPNSLALETSRLLGVGKRIPLDLSLLDNFSLFPGQIVALRGKNASGEYFKVDEILDIPLLGASVNTKEELKEYYPIESTGLKTIIATGPYTTNTDLEFNHLENLIENINSNYKPNLVIFFGPFIDITHPLIANGNLDLTSSDGKIKPKTLDEVFKLIITPILKKLNDKIQVILIPSLKDSISNHAAYPQDSFDRKKLLLPKNFKSFPNPSIFQINEFVVGVSNNDIFRDLKDVNRGDEFVKLNRFERLAGHIIEQRRFYPFFPGSSKSRKRKINNLSGEVVEQLPASDLDVPYLGLSEFNETVPDILIIPSELRFFAKIVKNVLIINPGAFMRPSGPGSFISLTLKAPNFEKLTKINDNSNEELYLHDVWDRARVDIIKS